MAKSLKIWNGRGYCARKHNDPLWGDVKGNGYVHGYVAAYSRADARKLIEEYCGHAPSDSEIKNYWAENAWGNDMQGIEPVRGLWLKFGTAGKPIKVA